MNERECLAVIRAIEKFRGYVEGVRFTVYCDHAALSYLKSMKKPTALMSRWFLRLNAFDFNIKYRKGSVNVVPDALSRFVAGAVLSLDDIKDPWYQGLAKCITNDGDNFPDFRLVGAEIYKNCLCRDEIGTTVHIWKKVISSNHRLETIKKCHDSATAAHLGFRKTWKNFKLISIAQV